MINIKTKYDGYQDGTSGMYVWSYLIEAGREDPS